MMFGYWLLRFSFLWAGLAGVAVGGVAGWLVFREVLKRIERRF